ncbi:MAG: hypothetical protein HKP38_08090 [Croceitalea sp.]|nr:hypothetical protein [Croceitalea sp.]
MALTNSFAQKEIPESILKEAKVALSFYPQLENVPIVFKFKKNIKKSTMQAQPIFGSLFTTRKKRRYVVLISERFKIAQTTFLTKDIPEDIMIGWLGHELGHIMDYKNRSSLNLIWFGIKYYFSSSSIQEAERAADGYAVNSGMEKYILKTKDFILNQAGISEKYKERIKRLYLSQEEIMELVEEREALNLP